MATKDKPCDSDNGQVAQADAVPTKPLDLGSLTISALHAAWLSVDAASEALDRRGGDFPLTAMRSLSDQQEALERLIVLHRPVDRREVMIQLATAFCYLEGFLGSEHTGQELETMAKTISGGLLASAAALAEMEGVDLCAEMGGNGEFISGRIAASPMRPIATGRASHAAQ